MRSVSNPFEYEKYRKEKINKKLEESRNSRIVIKKKKKVNENYLQEIKESNKTGVNQMLQDDRFKQMFTDERFEIEKTQNGKIVKNK